MLLIYEKEKKKLIGNFQKLRALHWTEIEILCILRNILSENYEIVRANARNFNITCIWI